MRDLAHMEVKGRIAGALLQISAQFGVDRNKYLALTLTRQDIASYAGTTYETVFKFFNDLKKAKIISTHGKNIKIEDEGKLSDYLIT